MEAILAHRLSLADSSVLKKMSYDSGLNARDQQNLMSSVYAG